MDNPNFGGGVEISLDTRITEVVFNLRALYFEYDSKMGDREIR